MENVVIVEAKRTPIGSFGGNLSSFSAPELGATAIREVIKQSGIKPDDVQEVVFGNVLTAGIGQAPARQAALKAGLSEFTPATTVNKVCASGMKAAMIAANQIQLGEAEVINLQREKQDAKEVFEGSMCGLNLKTTKKVVVEEGDKLEFFTREMVKRHLA